MILENIEEFFRHIQPGRPLMALDMGEKRVGIALSDITQKIAFPKEVYERKNMRQDMGYMNRRCREEQVSGIVIGLPLNHAKEESPFCQSVRSFAAKLTDKTQLPILLMDERLSTAAVTRVMQEADVNRKDRHAVDDKLAAGYLLQTVLDIACARRENA